MLWMAVELTIRCGLGAEFQRLCGFDRHKTALSVLALRTLR
jgi:hypothetical protein